MLLKREVRLAAGITQYNHYEGLTYGLSKNSKAFLHMTLYYWHTYPPSQVVYTVSLTEMSSHLPEDDPRVRTR